MDIFGNIDLRKVFKRDPVLHDNLLFKLHHQANFTLVLFGVAFVFGMNYLNGNAIVCTGKEVQDYHKQFCWLHGSGHIPPSLAGQMNIKCQADQNDNSDPNERHTHYYLWIPFVLGLLLIIIKAPRFIWKVVFERGHLKGVVGDGKEIAEKMSYRFTKLKKRNRARFYYVGYFICEMLNLLCLVACFFILDSLFDGKFRDYGTNVLNYDKTDSHAVDPKCNLFPTEVSCNVQTGGIDGNADENNFLCLLSNNLFNQYYFLILWWWWVTLLALSVGGFVYRLAQIISTDISRNVFIYKISPFGQAGRVKYLKDYGQAEFFLLGRICQNLKGSQIEDLMYELVRSESPKTVDQIEEQKLMPE